ncbi:hypothetical protein KRZ98_03905 [Sphingobium sp. AS12]|uniref:hypothetical protein n=1 Tax=Sphingobium sp. AS12 TaxID=2849495 RepID=UPI001C315F30|nr:hypothetical protein [Sphingobium sp. AS12]MBV2147430.1 hypothetical protein [Sphingobium sp. AS12]
MGVINHPEFPPAAAALIAARLLNKHSVGEIGAAIEILIDVLDLIGGDPDAENGNDLEDDFTLSPMAVAYGSDGAGCAISDQDAGAWIEWHTMRGSQKRGPNILAGREDDEDDDPAEQDDESGQCDEDEVNTSLDRVRYTTGAGGAGCPISDAGGGNVEDEGQINEVQPYTGPLAFTGLGGAA